MHIRQVLILASSVYAQSFTFSIALPNLPSTGIAPASALQVQWTFDTCGAASKSSKCAGATNVDAIPKGLTKMILRRGTFQSAAVNTETDLMNGVDPVTALSRGLGSTTFTIQTLPTEPDYYTIYMEALDINNNPVSGISQVFIIGNSPTARPNSIVLISPIQGSVLFTETFDAPYLIRWQYVGITLIPDTFSVDLIDTNDKQVVPIYSRSRYLFNDTLLTGFPTPSAKWVVPGNLAGQQYKIKMSAFSANSSLAGISTTSGIFSIQTGTTRSDAVELLAGYLAFAGILLACY